MLNTINTILKENSISCINSYYLIGCLNELYDDDYKKNVVILKMSKSSKETLNKLVSKKMSLKEFINTSDMRLHPDKYKKELEEVEKRSKVKTSFKTIEIDCNKCGHNRGFYQFIILRSLDEPKVLKTLCEKCGHQSNYD